MSAHSRHAPLSHKACVSHERRSPSSTFMALSGALSFSAPHPENKYGDVSTHLSLIHVNHLRVSESYTDGACGDSSLDQLNKTESEINERRLTLSRCIEVNVMPSRSPAAHLLQI